MAVRRGIQGAADVAIRALLESAEPVLSKSQIEHVAGISANEKEVGEIIADVMEKVGKDGVITIEESRGLTGCKWIGVINLLISLQILTGWSR